MKVLHTADWHIGQFKGPVEDGVNLRSLDTVKCLGYMVEKAREEQPDLVCISGDVFHQEQIGPVRYSDEMVTATRIIDELSKVSKFVVVMRGTPNHDGAGQFRVLTKMLEHNKKVAVVTTPQVISTPIADIVCIPGFDISWALCRGRKSYMDQSYQRNGYGIESTMLTDKYCGRHGSCDPDGTLYSSWLQYGIRTDIVLFKF